MNDFVSIEILGTMTGCSLIITLLTQVFKKYLPKKEEKQTDPKWLALLFSIIVGVLRIVYIHQFDFAGITSGVLNIFVLLAEAIGIYEITDGASHEVKNKINFNFKEGNAEQQRKEEK